MRIADRITVFRDGRYVGTIDRGRSERQQGHQYDGRPRTGQCVAASPGQRIGEPCSKCATSPAKASLTCRTSTSPCTEGEILGFAGLVGAGRSETARAIFGADRIETGEILLNGQPVRFRSPKEAIAQRHRHGARRTQTASAFHEHAHPLQHRHRRACPPAPPAASYATQGSDRLADEFVHKLSIKLSSIDAPVKSLSGGNQQKTVLARWLATKPKVLILDEPTHGVDVGAKADIYQLMRDLAAAGIGIILISSELPEILNMSDRIVVMHEGRITGSPGWPRRHRRPGDGVCDGTGGMAGAN